MNDKDEILKRMRSRLTLAASCMEGSFSGDNLQAVASEIARIHSEDYEMLLERAHIMTATGEDLDEAARENHGMLRNAATYEEVNLLFTGLPDTAIDRTMGAYADDIIFMVSGEYVIPASGSILVNAVCTEKGAGHSVPAGVLTNLLSKYSGVTSVTNPEPSFGGYDQESDENFRTRIIEKEKDIPGYGNTAWYRSTALEVTGVEKAKAIDLARGKGTVDVVIIASGSSEASSGMIQRVADHINAERIIGADVLVKSGTAVAVNCAANVYISANKTISSVEDAFKKQLARYLTEMDFSDAKTSSRVSYAKISQLLIETDGVIDIDDLQLNGTSASVALSPVQFPVMGTVTLHKRT